MCKTALPRATLGRLPRYLEHVRQVRARGVSNTSATAIARALGLGEVQVRKDLSAVSGAGKPKTGYLVDDLINALETQLGCHHKTQAVLVGAGELGRALLNYDGFSAYGTEIVAGFDVNPPAPDAWKGLRPIYPARELPAFLAEHAIPIGIITVPAAVAQQVCDALVDGGVQAIWSFAPVQLRVPESIILMQENLALSLAFLNGQRNASNELEEE